MASGIHDQRRSRSCACAGLAFATAFLSDHGRGLDLLPADVTAQFQESLVRQLLDTEELAWALGW